MSRKLFSQPYIFFETSIKDQVEGKVFEESKQEVDLQVTLLDFLSSPIIDSLYPFKVVLIDQDFWRHPEEVDLIIKPLKQNLLLGSAASKCPPLNTIFTKLSIRVTIFVSLFKKFVHKKLVCRHSPEDQREEEALFCHLSISFRKTCRR